MPLLLLELLIQFQCWSHIFGIHYFSIYENACVNEKHVTPIMRSRVTYSKYGTRKVKEFMQGINVYTNIQSIENIQRENSLSMRDTKGEELHLECTRMVHYFIVSHDEYESEGEQWYTKYNENNILSTKTHLGTQNNKIKQFNNMHKTCNNNATRNTMVEVSLCLSKGESGVSYNKEKGAKSTQRNSIK